MSRRALTEDWTIELDDALNGEVIDGSLRFASAGPPTRTIWIAAWNPPVTDEPSTTIAWARDTAARTGPPVAQSQVFEEGGADGEELRYARWYFEPNASPAHWALYAYTARRGGLVQAAFLVEDANGLNWALEAWRSLRHRSTATTPAPFGPPAPFSPPAPFAPPTAPAPFAPPAAEAPASLASIPSAPMPQVAPPAEPIAMPQVAPLAEPIAMPVVASEPTPTPEPEPTPEADPSAPAEPPTLAPFVRDAPDIALDPEPASLDAPQPAPPQAEPVAAAPPFVPPIPEPAPTPSKPLPYIPSAGRPDPLSPSTPLSALTQPSAPQPPRSAPPLVPPIPAPPTGPPAPSAPLTLEQRAEDSLRARQEAWRQLGQLDQEEIAHVAAAPGAPAQTVAWPTERQAFIRVRRGQWTILSSDGLSDASDEANPLGLGIEVFVEVDDPALTGPMSAVPGNWATSLLRQGAQAIAKNGRPMVEWLAANRVGSIEFGGVAVPPAFQARGAQGEPVVGALIGVLPFALPYQIALPAGPIRLLPITLLTARETDYVRAAGAAGREWLAGALANAGPAHRSTLARQSLI
ncbi:MAG: hypothetical protein JWN20_55 [Jatrophihabitantaceae bacterium]|nr:hypothetical protein [Jatrophihabitantaceae bacterium]